MDKKAIVVGGSNGIGLAIVNDLMNRGYHVCIYDICEPEVESLHKDAFSYEYTDLNHFNHAQWIDVAKDKDVEVLMISSGIGRISEFENFDITEIEKTMNINATSAICLIREFYERIMSDSQFYTGVMASISGRISSPIAALYGASKASLVRLIESVNIELEKKGTKNRILEVSPGALKGTRFYGGNNDVDLNKELANEIVERMLKSETLFIPDFEKTYKRVIDNYNSDAHSFGLSSYDYKKESNRINDNSKTVIGYLSGTFDLFHLGHLNLLKRAKKECDYLIVGVHNSGAWKGKETIVPLEERKEIVAACRYVDKVIDSYPEDKDVWADYHYHKLFVGSDYEGTERFKAYEEYFKDKDVKIVYFPYTKTVSSTMRRNDIKQRDKE